MRTPEQQEAWEWQAFGCLATAIENARENMFGGSSLAMAMSILSDAQELLELAGAEGNSDAVRWGYSNSIRQAMNRAKYLIGQARKDARMMEDGLDTQVKMLAVLHETMKGI